MCITQIVSDRWRWCSTTWPVTPCVRSAGWCWSHTLSMRPPSGGLSQTNRVITTRFVSVGRPTCSQLTKGSPPSQPSPMAPPESSSPPPSADGRIAVPTPIMVFLGFFFFLINFWVCVLGSEFMFLFKTHLDLNSYDFQFLIQFLIFLFS